MASFCEAEIGKYSFFQVEIGIENILRKGYFDK